MTQSEKPTPSRRINNISIRRLGLTLTGLGIVVFLVGAVPHWFNLDNSQAVGFVQVAVFSIGLLLICLGGTFALNSLWPSHWRSIFADIGLRLAWTGWVFAISAALADVFGLGTRPLATSVTFFGPWQALGVMIGEGIMFIGFLMMIPYQKEFPPLPGEEPDADADAKADDKVQAESEEEPAKPTIVVDESD